MNLVINFRNISAKVETLIKPEVQAFQILTLSNDVRTINKSDE